MKYYVKHDIINEIKEALEGKEAICIHFPLYLPEHPLFREERYSVVGRRANHPIIVQKVKVYGYEAKELRPDVYLFWLKTLEEEKVEEILQEFNAALVWLYD